jgi:RNA polymerase sigma-70 factor (ECF subfamily)
MSEHERCLAVTPCGGEECTRDRCRVLVRRARTVATPEARAALEAFCEASWPKVLGIVRRQGYRGADAEDLTQAYFARFFEKGYVNAFRPEIGRFRTFLLASVTHFLANEWDREQAKKRGGGARHLSLDASSAEERLRLEPVDHLTPEAIFERQWTAAVLARCVERLRAEQSASGTRARFERLKSFLTGEGAPGDYAGLAPELGLSASTVRVAVHRLRRRFAEVLREEVAGTLTEPAEVEAEIRWMLESLRSDK